MPPNTHWTIDPTFATSSTATLTFYGWVTSSTDGSQVNATIGTYTLNITGAALGSNNANTFITVTIVPPTTGTFAIIATGGV
jgi:hypothetical protein